MEILVIFTEKMVRIFVNPNYQNFKCPTGFLMVLNPFSPSKTQLKHCFYKKKLTFFYQIPTTSNANFSAR